MHQQVVLTSVCHITLSTRSRALAAAAIAVPQLLRRGPGGMLTHIASHPSHLMQSQMLPLAMQEQEYIKQEARSLFRQNKTLTATEAIEAKV